MRIKTENIKSKLVHDPLVARALLKRGMHAIDCKPLKNDKTRTVIVFEDTPQFRQALSELAEDWISVDVPVKEVNDPRIARALLKRGMKLLDYKEAKANNPSKMMFVFEATDEFDEVYAQILEERAKKDAEYEQIEIEFDVEVEVDLD